MRDFTPAAPSPSFHTYRRQQFQAAIHTPAHSSRHNPVAPEPEWVAVLTCRGTGDLLTAAEVALIKLAGRCAAGAVHQAQQAQQLHRRQHLIDNLSAALHTDGEIGVAVGVLMQQHQLTYRQAFDLLVETASTHHQRAGLTDGNLTVVSTETSGG